MFKKYLVSRGGKAVVLMTVVFFVALFSHADLEPLEETHWDAPTFVQLAKRSAETDILAGYRNHAGEITPGPVGAHWHFTRIGHILILGEVTRLFDSSETALVTMQWIYRFFMAMGVTLCIFIGLRLRALLCPERTTSIWWLGYTVAAFSYIASDSFRGLQGHMISEPPAFALMALFASALLLAVERHSIWLSATAGALLFAMFFIRADAVLPGVVFLMVSMAWFAIRGTSAVRVCFAVVCLVSFSFYLVYAWYFAPLISPVTLLEFFGAKKTMYTPLPFIRNLFQVLIAGGFLWVGAAASLANWRKPVVRFAAIWLAITLMPLIIESFRGGPIQVRMACFITLPLIILAGEGWAWILERFFVQRNTKPAVLAVVLLIFLALVPYGSMMQSFRQVAINYLPLELKKKLFASANDPGGIQPLVLHPDSRMGLLVRPMHERLTYDFHQARVLGSFLYNPVHFGYVIWPSMDSWRQGTLREFVGLIRYFGKAYPESADLVMHRLPNRVSSEACSNKKPTELEPIVFCTSYTAEDKKVLKRENVPVYVIGSSEFKIPDVAGDKLVVRLAVAPYVLYELAWK